MILANLCSHIVDCAHKTAPTSDSGEYFAVGTPAMRGNIINYAEARRISRDTFDEWTMRLRPREGDLLLAREAPVGPVVRVPASENVAPGQRTVLLRPNQAKADSRFLYYYLISPNVQVALLQKASGSTVPHLNVADVRTFPTPDVPGLPVQRSIADVLGALDDKIAANDRQCAIALDLADTLFRGNPAGGAITLGELVDRRALTLGDGYRTKRSEHGIPGFRILRAGDIQGHRIDPAGDDFVSSSYCRQVGSKVSRPGDIVMTTKGTVGRVAVVPELLETLVYSPQLCYFRVSDNTVLDSYYVAAWFRSEDLQRQASLLMHKSDMAPYINLRDIRSLKIPVPPIAEQRKQGRVQKALLAGFDAAGAENLRLATMRDELLPLLISGKLRVRDAEKVAEGVV